jgi:hypothetical protein
MIDEPSPFDSLEIWERHLAQMLELPDSEALKKDLVRSARYWIGRKKRAEK